MKNKHEDFINKDVLVEKKLTDILLQRRDPDNKALRLLEKGLRKHPYSQPLSMMYAKVLRKLDKPGFEAAVNKAAACAPDQKVFRAFIADRQTLPVSDEKPEADIEAAKETALAQTDHSPAPDQQAGIKRKKGDHQAIIDRFLENEPRISAPRDDIPAGELAPESLSEPDDLVSETLAEVFVKQGKLGRAIEIFEKLSLKFPEKSSYFAKKIESISQENT